MMPQLSLSLRPGCALWVGEMVLVSPLSTRATLTNHEGNQEGSGHEQQFLKRYIGWLLVSGRTDVEGWGEIASEWELANV